MMKRDIAYQVALLFIIGAVVFLVAATTQQNLARLGVDSSIDFLWKRAGFEIGQKLIPFNAESTIARAFFVALLNTLALAAVSIVCASILGLIIGIARLSDNWLVSRLATAYIEIFRNIPSLLQIFFWYFVVLRTLPRSGDSIEFFNCIFLNNRGLFVPAVSFGQGWVWIAGALFVAWAMIYLLRRQEGRREYSPGRTRSEAGKADLNPRSSSSPPPLNSSWGQAAKRASSYNASWSLLILAGVVGVVILLAGAHWEVPRETRFGYRGGIVMMPEFLSLVVGLSMYNATYIGEIVRSAFTSIPRGQTEAAASLGLPRSLTIRLVLFPQALRVIIPPLTTVYLNLFKSTSLAAAIAYPEVVSVFVGTVNNLVGQPVFIMAITMAVYVFISLCIALFLNWYNRKIALTSVS